MQKSIGLNPSGPNQLEYCTVFNVTTGKTLLPSVMIADNDADRALGFQFWPELMTGDAMLFLFDDEQVRNMHMRNVAFPLMMCWINTDRIVIGMTLAQQSNTQLYSSKVPVRYCLECHPAIISRLQAGDELRFTRNEE